MSMRIVLAIVDTIKKEFFAYFFFFSLIKKCTKLITKYAVAFIIISEK